MLILAHRGAHYRFPENSIPAFEEAISLGADGIEFDVRLTKDRIPVVLHPVEVERVIGMPGYVFGLTLKELQSRPLLGTSDVDQWNVPTLAEVLNQFAGRIGLDIEIKAPEPEAAAIVAEELSAFDSYWPSVEITSFEPATLRDVNSRMPEMAADLLIPSSEPWMTPEIVAHMTLHRARLAGARGVYLHPTQLSEEGVDRIREAGINIHCWGVNTVEHLEIVREFGIPKLDTDNPEEMLRLARGPE